MIPRTGGLLLLSLSSIFSTSGQIQAPEGVRRVLAGLRPESLYQRSLSACVEAKTLNTAASGNFIVLENLVLSDMDSVKILPTNIGPTTIEYLDAKAVMERYRRVGSKFDVLEILPIRNAREVLIVNCAEYRVSMRRRKLVLGVAGGYMVHWRYDCSAAKYVNVKVERWTPGVD